MPTVYVRRKIKAPIDKVFSAFTDIERMPDTNPDVKSTTFLGDQKTGVGTKFREIRENRGKEMSFDLEVLEFLPNEKVRMVNDTHGTTWDTTISFHEADGETKISLAMEARALQLLPKIINPLAKSLFRKGLESHVDAVQAFCEGR